MSGLVINLTFWITLLSVAALMRRPLRIRTTHMPTRLAEQQLAFAYELLVSTHECELPSTVVGVAKPGVDHASVKHRSGRTAK